jgi:dipeptidyl aminopeptidase/acylaminoacyl peptidase
MDGGQFRRLTDDGFRDRGPAWAPDGHRIAFYSDRGGGYEIWTIRPDGSGLEAATALGRSANFPTWSPDGRRLVFSSTSAGGLLLDMTSAGRRTASEELPPVRGSALFWPFSWSRDGRRLAGLAVLPDGRILGIAVYSIATRSYDVFEENLSSFFRNPRWLGDGQRLLVRDAQGIRLLDTRTRKSRLLLPVGGYMIGKSVGVTADDRWITFTETAAEGDVWLAAFE